MKRIIKFLICTVLSIILFACKTQKTTNTKDFSQWKQDGVITQLISYMESITDEKSPDYIPVKDRLAVFDLDGTLVCEQFPIYVEWILFSKRVLDDADFEATAEMKQLAKEMLDAGKNKSIPKNLEEDESVLFGQAFDGMSISEYRKYVDDFLNQKADGFDNLTYGEAYFRPMVEIISYLQKNQFKIYICSGTDRDLDRVMAAKFSDIPMYQIIGTDYYSEGSKHDEIYYLDYQFEKDEEVMRDNKRIIKNVKASKVVQMAQELGQKPVLAFGNSTGDTSMFVYTTSGNKYKSAAFCVIPDDDVREYAFENKVSNLKKLCADNNWNVISMKEDFLSIYGKGVRKNSTNMVYTEYLLSLLEE